MATKTLEELEDKRREVLADRLVGWKLFYIDGTVVTSRDCAFEDAPQCGVAVLIRYLSRPKKTPFRDIQFGLDLYTLFPFDALEVELPTKVKAGGYTHPNKFFPILSAAQADDEIVEQMAMEAVT